MSASGSEGKVSQLLGLLALLRILPLTSPTYTHPIPSLPPFDRQMSTCADMLILQSTMQVIRTSLRNEGAMFMFKGWVPAWSRLQPTTILIFLTLEQLRQAVDWTRSKREAREE